MEPDDHEGMCFYFTVVVVEYVVGLWSHGGNDKPYLELSVRVMQYAWVLYCAFDDCERH